MPVIPQCYLASTQPARGDLDDAGVYVDRLEGNSLFEGSSSRLVAAMMRDLLDLLDVMAAGKGRAVAAKRCWSSLTLTCHLCLVLVGANIRPP